MVSRLILTMSLAVLSGCAHYALTPEVTRALPAQPDNAAVERLSLIAARGVMKDPDSVQIRGLTQAKPSYRVGPFGSVEASGWGWFGQVNGKNSFGGYVGFQRFSFFYDGQQIWMFEDDKGWNEVIHYEPGE